ncbi:hypothetical protein LMG27174_02120 [Paraburkholderia rhynchosiae]|uniref:Uncharacterized protein n=1 Tax=Paraburkholderia rhynchosiae TaxID=487049 RepID=A0A6J5ANJ5_9BURK|nr:hypothetical protein LMG27174_02120 [Paraburkholderia rhynchosiae]
MTIRMDIVLAGQRIKQWPWRACVARNAWGWAEQGAKLATC